MAFASGSKANFCQTFCCIIIHSHEHLIKLIGTSCWICEDVTRNKNLFSPPPADGSLWGLTAEHVHLSPFSNLNWAARRSIYRFAFSLNKQTYFFNKNVGFQMDRTPCMYLNHASEQCQSQMTYERTWPPLTVGQMTDKSTVHQIAVWHKLIYPKSIFLFKYQWTAPMLSFTF